MAAETIVRPSAAFDYPGVAAMLQAEATLSTAATLQSCWVKRAPAVNILHSGPAGLAFAHRLCAANARVIALNLGEQHWPDGTPIDLLATGLPSAVADCDVTIIDQADELCASGELVALASSLGGELHLKPAYHVVVVLGLATRGTVLMDVITEAIENASGKHLGPDFGLCVIEGFADYELTHGLQGQLLQPTLTVLATSRRAGETVRALLTVMDQFVTLKPLILDQKPYC